MRRKLIWTLFVAVAALAAYAGNVLATPPHDAGLQRHDAGEGHLRRARHQGHGHDPTSRHAVWKAQLKTKGDSDLYVQQNTWDPSACNGCIPSSGWHTHPGPSLVIVTQGTVTAYDGDDPTCTPHVYSADGTNAFVDIGSGDVHIIRDESGAVAKTVVVQLIPKDATRRIDASPAPGNCPF